MDLIVQTKHFILDPETKRKIYDKDEDFIFKYDMKTLRIFGSTWKKDIEPDNVADIIFAYFKGTNYTIANIIKKLD